MLNLTRGRPSRNVPHYREAAATIRQKVAEGTWRPGQPLPSLRSLGQLLGVGKGTVRNALRVLSEEGLVSWNLRGHCCVSEGKMPGRVCAHPILEVITTPLRRFLGKRSHQLSLQRGIEMGASDLQAPLWIYHSYHLNEAMPVDLSSHLLQGILLLGRYSDELLEKYQALPIPVVQVDNPKGESRMHSICVENESAAREATERLIALGHRRICFIRRIHISEGAFDPDAMERQRGFEQAMRAAGLSVEHIYNFTERDKRVEHGLWKSILDMRPRITAVMGSDQNLINVFIRAARERGLTIPRDFSVICFQDKEFANRGLAGPRNDFQAMGRTAVNVLKEHDGATRVIRMPATFHTGKTLAAPLG